jgi:glycerophosphoryl diester phosphodiesterase
VLGADAVELDVRRTADGVLVVHHDAHLEDGRVIAQTTHGDLPSSVPTLGEALDACEGMWVNVEIKNAPDEPDFDPTDRIADETVAHLLGRDTDARWLISSFRIETVDRCHAIAPAIRTAWLCVDVPLDASDEPGVDGLVARGHTAIHPWVGTLTRDVVDACHRAGLEVNTWTCDDPERMEQLIEWGIDGICTNVPDVALGVLSRRLDAPT